MASAEYWNGLPFNKLSGVGVHGILYCDRAVRFQISNSDTEIYFFIFSCFVLSAKLVPCHNDEQKHIDFSASFFLNMSLMRLGSLRLQHRVFPHRSMSVVPCSRQEILPLAHIHPANPIHMPLHRQVTNSASSVPYSYAVVMRSCHDPLSVIGKERSRMHPSLRYQSLSVNIAE